MILAFKFFILSFESIFTINVNVYYTDNILYNMNKYKIIAEIMMFVHKEH